MIKKEILQNQKRISELTIKERKLNISEIEEILSLHKILAFIGSRRAGKTFLAFQTIKTLIKENKINLQDVCYIDFSCILDKNLTIEKIKEDYFSIFPEKTPFFVFDEIQELYDFAPQLIKVINEGYKVIVTGSNAHLLSKELSTILRGKVYSKEIFPLDFEEYLTFRDIPHDTQNLIRDISKYRGYFVDFLQWGGFPEIALIRDELIKEHILKSYFDIMLYKDLQDRYSIKNDFALRFFIKRVLSSIGKEININKIYNELKSQGIKISKDSLYNFYEYLDDIYFISSLKNYWAQIKGGKKSFLIDISFLNLISSSEEFGRKFENVIFIELLKRNHDIYFLRKNYEIDFYIPDKNIYIQVVYDLNSENSERELSNLAKQAGRKIVIYYDRSESLIIPHNIELMSFDQFLFGTGLNI